MCSDAPAPDRRIAWRWQCVFHCLTLHSLPFCVSWFGRIARTTCRDKYLHRFNWGGPPLCGSTHSSSCSNIAARAQISHREHKHDHICIILMPLPNARRRCEYLRNDDDVLGTPSRVSGPETRFEHRVLAFLRGLRRTSMRTESQVRVAHGELCSVCICVFVCKAANMMK